MDTTFCACGCGEETPVWHRNQLTVGRVKGEHAKWVNGHGGRTRRVVDDKLWCRDCSEWKPLEQFYPNPKAGRIGKSSYCKVCQVGRARWSNYVAKYSLSREAYQALLHAQGGVCAICGIGPEKPLRVDHCHDSLRVRGLLCDACNTGLGQFKDNADYLRRAIDYLS